MLRETDTSEGGEAEYIELNKSLWPREEVQAVVQQEEVQQESEEAPIPQPFEYSFDE